MPTPAASDTLTRAMIAPCQPLPVIPVLDLLAGRVVRAVRGERGAYQPMQSQLVPGSDPLPLARALLAHPACSQDRPILYIADLDAIQGRSAHIAELRRLLQTLSLERPAFRLWLDAGFDGPASAAALRETLGRGNPGLADRLRPVYGSESMRTSAALDAMAADPDAILSLDCRLDQALDPAGCWQRPDRWPATLIVMTLDRVGAQRGPDLATFDRLQAQAAGRCMVGAGGIRDRSDLVAARAAGASAWLVASALHDGSLETPAGPRQA